MKNILLVFLSTLFFSVSAYEIDDKWFFSEIKSETTNNTNFNKDDILLINNDNTFEYQIFSKDLYAKGSWQLIEDKLIFNYILPNDTTREYIVKVSSNSLVLIENNVKYIFSKNTPIVDLENEQSLTNKIFRGILGLLSLIFLAFIFSKNKRNINWSLVTKGLLIQLFLALMILKVPIVQNVFEWISAIFVTVLQFSKQGALFLFGETLVNSNEFGAIFAFQILPTIIFFSALTSLLFYLGILQKIVYFFALLMKKTLKLSGAESLSAAGNIFLGQTESPLLVKPYIEKMTS